MPRLVQTYDQALEFLFGRINYERAASGSYKASDFKLERMARLLDCLGHPQRRLPAVHIAGTKGKGSTAAMTAGILSAAGYRTGLFTSPHLTAFEERMTVDTVRPSPQQLVALVNQIVEPVRRMDAAPGMWQPTYFEIATAMGWLYFVQSQVDIVVLEVGLGGRLDATNLCRPAVTVVTNISRDHTQLLGWKLAEIAREKAGIIKAGIPVVSGVHNGDARRVIEDVCQRQSAPLIQLGRDIRYHYRPQFGNRNSGDAACEPRTSTIDVEIGNRHWTNVPVPLAGAHQARNAALALAVVDVLIRRGRPVPDEAVHTGMAGVRWPARIEVLGSQPTVIVDAAHNVASVQALLDTIRQGFDARQKILLFAATRDKDVAGLLRRLLAEFDHVVLTRYVKNPRGVPVPELNRLALRLTDRPIHSAPEPVSAWHLARQLGDYRDLICVTGSFLVAAEVRELILAELNAPRIAPGPCDAPCPPPLAESASQAGLPA